MTLSSMMTATASTQRTIARVGSKFGDPVTNLESVSITPLMLVGVRNIQGIRQATGLEGTAVQIWQAYTESHEHTDSSSTVTQIPDIVESDLLISDGITYKVVLAQINPATSSFIATLILYLTESKRLT